MQPDIAPQAWQLEIVGAVNKPQTLDWQQLQAMELVESVSDMHCVTTWSRYDNHWRGLATRALLALVEPSPQARFVMAESFDSYTTNMPIEALQEQDSLLAIQWEGQALDSRTWRTRASPDTALVFVEECEVATKTRLHDRRPTGILGKERLSYIMPTRG